MKIIRLPWGSEMVLSSLPTAQAGKGQGRTLAAIALCALFLAAAANANRNSVPSGVIPDYKAAEKSMRQIRIKRLKPADPESTEVMLAGRALVDPGITLV